MNENKYLGKKEQEKYTSGNEMYNDILLKGSEDAKLLILCNRMIR